MLSLHTAPTLEDMDIEPKYDVADIVEATGYSRYWVNKLSVAKGWGVIERNRYRYTRAEFEQFLEFKKNAKMGNPNWTKKDE